MTRPQRKKGWILTQTRERKFETPKTKKQERRSSWRLGTTRLVTSQTIEETALHNLLRIASKLGNAPAHSTTTQSLPGAFKNAWNDSWNVVFSTTRRLAYFQSVWQRSQEEQMNNKTGLPKRGSQHANLAQNDEEAYANSHRMAAPRTQWRAESVAHANPFNLRVTSDVFRTKPVLETSQ